MAQELSTVLEIETLNGPVLQRRTLPVAVPAGAASTAFRFKVEFASSELPINNAVLDAATISLRSADRRYAATLLTIDAFGPLPLPFTPNATTISPSDFSFSESLGQVPAGFLSLSTCSVVVELPEPTSADPMTLVLTLFNNLDGAPSRVVLRDTRLVPSLHTPITVESSASLVGPFSVESGAVDNRAARTLRVSRPPMSRFFRLEGETLSRITKFQSVGDEWWVDYTAELGTPRVQIEGSNDGSNFQTVTNATIDFVSRKARVPIFRSFAFFRIGGSHPGKIVGDEVSGENRILTFELAAPLPRLLSSATPNGPFSLEGGVAGDPFLGRLRLPREGAVRYFRLRSSMALKVVSLVPEADAWVIGYEEL